jgi:hypothetical protein
VTNPNLISLNDVQSARAAGLTFVRSAHQLRWLLRTAPEKGLARAFVRLGRRVFLDPAAFHELSRRPQLRQQRKRKR